MLNMKSSRSEKSALNKNTKLNEAEYEAKRRRYRDGVLVIEGMSSVVEAWLVVVWWGPSTVVDVNKSNGRWFESLC